MPRTEIDPQLPYIQVHRSVGAMAAQLAPLLGVTYQHVRGALDVFWESLADRRILARALALPEPMVVLDDLECRQRLQLAFGAKVEPRLMCVAGALETLPDQKWRVRGMSRYLISERKRLGLKATPTPVEAGPNPGCTPPAPPPEVGSDPAKARGERREVRVKSEEFKGDSASDGSAESFWSWANDQRRATGHIGEHPPQGLSGWWSGLLMELGGNVGRAETAYGRFLADPHWRAQGCPFPAFRQQWPRYASEHYGRSTASGGDVTAAGTGPLTATELKL